MAKFVMESTEFVDNASVWSGDVRAWASVLKVSSLVLTIKWRQSTWAGRAVGKYAEHNLADVNDLMLPISVNNLYKYGHRSQLVNSHYPFLPYKLTHTRTHTHTQTITWDYDEKRPAKCIFKVNRIFRISMLILHVSALQEHHLQGA
jgi:hypothetical protein